MEFGKKKGFGALLISELGNHSRDQRIFKVDKLIC